MFDARNKAGPGPQSSRGQGWAKDPNVGLRASLPMRLDTTSQGQGADGPVRRQGAGAVPRELEGRGAPSSVGGGLRQRQAA